jgi:hypothetical protein
MQLAAFFPGIDMELSITGRLASLMPMKGTNMGGDLCEEFMKVLQSLDI